MMKRGFAATSALSFSLCWMGCQTVPPQSEDVARMASKTSQEAAFEISASAFDGARERFLPHANYLTMTTPYAPVAKLHGSLQSRLDRALVHRGEAHVTVLTPPEFEELSPELSIKEINEIALAHGIQKSKLEPVCLGRGEARVGKNTEQTYYIVVRAPGLVEIREAVLAAFLAKGGDRAKLPKFKPTSFFPHVTVGFTKVDLHEHQGVVKDERSCWAPLEFIR